MRVLYFTRDYTTHDRRFLSKLARTEHQVFYLRLERGPLQYEDRPLPPEIEQVRWAGGQEPARLSDGPRLLWDLKRVLRRVQPDLVHAGPLQTSAFLAALSGFHPLVSMSWGSDLLLEADRSRWHAWATRYTLRRSEILIGDCEPVRQKAVTLGMPYERIVTFPWGVDLGHFSPPQEPGGADGTFTIISTRGWEPVYGTELIARAFVQAAQARPDLRLLMLGGGSQAGLLRHIFQQGGVLEQVLFPGMVSQAELPRYFRSADLYVSASRSDGTSISLLEAMACGRPALVSDIPGNRQWIEPGVQGWWFPDGDAGALAQGFLQAAADRERLAGMGRAARQLAEARADWDKNFIQLLQAYQRAWELRRAS